MSKTSNTTTDHDEIRNWVEERNGKPAQVKGTNDKKGQGVLRIDFPGGAEESLEAISWEDFFKKFDQEKLAFLYQEKTANGETSYFNKVISREENKN